LSSDCVLLIGHGSREGEANAEFEALAAAYRATHPHLRVETAYVELARPLVAEALDRIAPEVRRIAVVPVFLFSAGHVKVDLPLAVARARQAHPRVQLAVAPALGVHPLLVELAFARSLSVLPEDAAARAKTLLLVVGRGSSDPDANGDFCKLARLVGEGRGLMHTEPTFIGITEPRVEASLDRVLRLRPDRLVVLPYLLFSGRLLVNLEKQVAEFGAAYPWIRAAVAPHLGADARLLSLITERAQSALRGEGVLPCDTCRYRVDVGGAVSQVGGLQALLYSVRHTLTHSQAAVPLHRHKPLKKHVLVCGNTDCVDRGSIALLEALRREIKAAGRSIDTRVTRTSCMGRCGEGPTVAVYPDGVWYRGVRADDAPEIVSEHLVADKLVSRLVDDILH
jgi:sirohydrochlorin cobaltochelatase